LRAGREILRPSGFEADALALLAATLDRRPEWILAHDDMWNDANASSRFFELCARRACGVPVPYLTRSCGFYGHEFYVDESVLVPRPETECLVADAVAFALGRRGPHVLDVGVGSGAAACSIAAECGDALVEGTDCSRAALDVANKNAHRLHVELRCDFHLANVVTPVHRSDYDVIIANLPYIPTDDVPRKPNPVAYEPRVALDGGVDGLAHYRTLLKTAPKLLHGGALLLLEAAPPSAAALAALTRAAFGRRARIEVRGDYGGTERYVRAAL